MIYWHCLIILKLNFFQVTIGTLMALNTYNGPIIWTLQLIKQVRRLGEGNLIEFYRSVAFFRGCELFVFSLVCLISRYHLFVWTVFSPKLLYEAMETLVITIFAFLIYSLNLAFTLKHKKEWRKTASSFHRILQISGFCSY